MKFKKIVILTLVVSFSFFLYQTLTAYSFGIIGRTKKDGGAGCTCHNFSPTASVSVIITGPASVPAGDTATYRLKLFGGPLIAGGLNVAAESGSLDVSYLEEQTQLKVNEITHTSPKLSAGGDTIIWAFKYTAPAIPNIKDTLYGAANSVNHNSHYTGDAWNFSANFVINILPSTSIVNTSEIVKEYSLSQNYPNPFNPSTKINFSVLKSGFVSLKLYDNLGRLSANLVNKDLTAGSYEFTLDAAAYGLISGMYYYTLQTNDFVQTKKMILMK